MTDHRSRTICKPTIRVTFFDTRLWCISPDTEASPNGKASKSTNRESWEPENYWIFDNHRLIRKKPHQIPQRRIVFDHYFVSFSDKVVVIDIWIRVNSRNHLALRCQLACEQRSNSIWSSSVPGIKFSIDFDSRKPVVRELWIASGRLNWRRTFFFYISDSCVQWFIGLGKTAVIHAWPVGILRHLTATSFVVLTAFADYFSRCFGHLSRMTE